jgi:protein translocase SecG subunit
MGLALGLLSTVAVLAAAALTLTVLVQEPKGGGIASAIGGQGFADVVGPRVGAVNRFTAYVAGVWLVACFLHAVSMHG